MLDSVRNCMCCLMRYLRGLSVALAYLWMKLSGFVYPPGGPLALVFVDKAAELDKKLGLACSASLILESTQIGKAIDSVLLRRLIPQIMWYMKGIRRFIALKGWNK